MYFPCGGASLFFMAVFSEGLFFFSMGGPPVGNSERPGATRVEWGGVRFILYLLYYLAASAPLGSARPHRAASTNTFLKIKLLVRSNIFLRRRK